MGQLVAIVGRPNVGKSTLFNRLTETRQAIVDPTAGTTRDRQYGKVEWGGKDFSIVDTGGWVVNSDDIFEEEINKQVEVAIEQADEILFVVDAMNGVTDLDDHVAEILRKSRKPVILVANKVDSNDWLYNVPEFYSLGLGDPFPVSAINGYGTGDLLDEVVKKLPEPRNEEENLEEIPKFAIVGRPNAGKSSLINALVPGADLKTGRISDIHHQGMHTTTFSEMVSLPGVGELIDVPGIRGFGTIDFQASEVSHYFPEIFRYGEGCRYGDCKHTGEPGCAVIPAVEEHLISESRFASYLSILDEIENPEKYRKPF